MFATNMILVWYLEKIPTWIWLSQGFFVFENLVKAMDLLFQNMIETHGIFYFFF